MTGQPIRVLAVDDHPIVRAGLRHLLPEGSPAVMAAEAADGREALEALRKADFDVMLLDISMPGIDWLEVLRKAKALRPRLQVLVLSVHKEPEFVTRSLQAGAAGYLTKESLGSELVQAVAKAAAGGRYISAQAGEALAKYLENGVLRSRHEGLSEREFQVMRLLARGRRPSEIARELFLSVHTVNTYKRRILSKMDATGTADLVRHALQSGLLE